MSDIAYEPGPSRVRHGRWMIVGSALVYGGDAVSAQLAYCGGFNSVTVMVLRYALATVLMFALARWQRAPLLAPAELRLRLLVVSTLQMLNTTFVYQSLLYLPPQLTVMFFYANPSITALLTRIFYRQPLGRVRLVALFLSVVGLLLLYYTAAEPLDIRGVLYALTAALVQATRFILTQRVAGKMPPLTFNFDLLVVVTLLALLLGGSGLLGPLSLAGIEAWAFLMPLYSALFVTVFGNYMVNKYLPVVGAVDSSLLLLLEPPTSALLSFLIFHEAFTGWQWLGALLIIVAVALPALAEKRCRKIRPSA